MYGPIDLSFPSLDGWHRSVCHINQINTFDYFFLLGQSPPVSQLKFIPWSTGLSGVTNTRQLATFSMSFYGLPISSFPTFKSSLTSLAKTSLKCMVLCLLNFQQSHFKLPVGRSGYAGIPGNKHADSLLCLLRCSLVPFSSYRQTRYSQYHKQKRHISTIPPISTDSSDSLF